MENSYAMTRILWEACCVCNLIESEIKIGVTRLARGAVVALAGLLLVFGTAPQFSAALRCQLSVTNFAVFYLLCSQFFQKASTTEDSEVHYNQDEYAEVTRLTKPVVYISVKEICNTHMVRRHSCCCCYSFVGWDML